MRKIVLKYLVHIILWGISFLLLYKLFTVEYDSGIADIIYTAIFHLPLLLAVYLNLPLMKYFFVRRSYPKYFMAVIMLGILSIGFYFLLFQKVVPSILKNYYFIAYYTPFQIARFVFAYVFLSSLLYLSVGWFSLREKENQLQRENYLVQLRNLKAQINPHFLFNSLNNIYALAGQDINLVRTYLTKLSDALRYMIYDTDAEWVPLKNEVEYLENYFDLERLRLGQSAEVSFMKEGKIDQYLIAPLILLPVVENCFSHCNRRSPFIQIELRVADEQLSLKTRNNKEDELLVDAGGIGLENVRKRLKLIYGSDGDLSISDKENLFEVQLTINLIEK